MAITKIIAEAPMAPEMPEQEQRYEESTTNTVKTQFTISDLDREIEVHTSRKEAVEKKIAELEKKKKDALAIK